MFFGARKIGNYQTAVFFLLCFSLSQINAQTKKVSLTTDSTEKLVADSANALANGDVAQAGTIIQKALAAAPCNVDEQTIAGAIADRKNGLPNAEKHFALAANLAPQSPATRNNYGAILVRLNRLAEAAKEFEASLAANPEQPRALVNLAQIRLAANDLPASRALFEKAVKISPDGEIWRTLITISLQLNELNRAAGEFGVFHVN